MRDDFFINFCIKNGEVDVLGVLEIRLVWGLLVNLYFVGIVLFWMVGIGVMGDFGLVEVLRVGVE